MLTAGEQQKLAELQEKAKSYTPLTDAEFKTFEQEVRDAYRAHLGWIRDLQLLAQNQHAEQLGEVTRQNSRLIQEVLYWKAMAPK